MAVFSLGLFAFYRAVKIVRTKKLNRLLQVKISESYQNTLREASEKTGVNVAELARLSLRLGLPKLLAKLPEVTND
jgi:hypothetical protein